MRRLIGLLLALAAMAAPAPALADADPAGCTDDLQYDPAIPAPVDFGGFDTGTTDRHVTADLYAYMESLVAKTATDQPAASRVRVIEKVLGPTTLGTRQLKYVVVSSPDNIDNLEAGRDDAGFWSGVIDGRTPASTALEQVDERPAFGWVTATPHGNEPAAGEASMRLLYELVARLDCQNAQRLRNMTIFVDPARNPDGRDANQRTTPWGFDPNRDFGTRTQVENRSFLPELTKYPGLFFIDAHQQSSGYFFPPNEDPVHHEISHFALDLIQNKIGPALQQKFNDQSASYRNYNTYDLFTPEYGDTVPALLMGAAGMTYEKGSSETYGKQVYDHYLAMDTTINVVSDDKPRQLAAWIAQWQEAIDQGARCELQQNTLVSPLHTEISQQPSGSVCGYFYKPGLHSGDVARLINELRETGVNVYRLDEDVTVEGVRPFGAGASGTDTLPAGTLWIPSAQPMKHWIQAVLGEDPFIPFPYFYDVVTWSYSLNRGMGGDGTLTQQIPSGVAMHAIGDPMLGTAPASAAPVYAFATDSMQALALAIELLHQGATVARSAAPFDAGGRHFPTGTALVDGSTLGGIDLAKLASDRETPVVGLPSYPTARYALQKPKIGLYWGPGQEPQNPQPAGGGTAGHCTSTAYCEALFTLGVKDGLPAGVLVGVGDAQVATASNNGFTAIVNPNQTMAGAGALQAFVNLGGRYVGTGSNGTTTARTAGLTTLNTKSVSGLTTPGTTFSSVVDPAAPAALAFDDGAFIYRSTSSEPVYDPASLATGDPVVPAATAAISYRDPLHAFGYQENAYGGDGHGGLAGTPAVVDQPFGAGHATLIAFNPFYRAWHESSERVVLNAALAPTGEVIPASQRATSRADADPAADPIPASRLPEVRPRPLAASSRADRDIRIEVARHDGRALRRAVRRTSLPSRIRRRARFERTPTVVRLVIRGVRTSDFERRAHWVGEMLGRLKRARVRPLLAQV